MGTKTEQSVELKDAQQLIDYGKSKTDITTYSGAGAVGYAFGKLTFAMYFTSLKGELSFEGKMDNPPSGEWASEDATCVFYVNPSNLSSGIVRISVTDSTKGIFRLTCYNSNNVIIGIIVGTANQGTVTAGGPFSGSYTWTSSN